VLVTQTASFALKVMDHLSIGFAAGCEAVAMPRRQKPIIFGARPWSGLSPSDLLGQRPHQRAKPKKDKGLTSGGKAEATPTKKLFGYLVLAALWQTNSLLYDNLY
jgi:hypothetical protein